MSKTKSKSGKKERYRNNSKSRKRKKLPSLKKRGRKMRRCFLCKAIILLSSKKLIACERSWRSSEANTKLQSQKLEISLKSTSNRKMSYWISSERRKRQLNLVTR